MGGEQLLEEVDGLRGRHRRLVANVWFIEAHHILHVAASQEARDARHELGDRILTPQHGHELDTVRQVAVRGRGPVVRPGDAAVRIQRLHGANVVVGGASLAGRGALALQRKRQSQSGRGHQGRVEDFLEGNHVCCCFGRMGSRWFLC